MRPTLAIRMAGSIDGNAIGRSDGGSVSPAIYRVLSNHGALSGGVRPTGRGLL
jgi:hypothetical protein